MCLRCTLKSGLHKTPTLIRTFPLGLENKHACKWTSRNADICVIPGKLSENHLNAWLFSNPRGQVLKSIKSMGQICPIPIKKDLSIWIEEQPCLQMDFRQIPGIICILAFLENCQEFICMHGCSLIHVERS